MKDKYRIPLFITLVLVSFVIFFVNRHEILEEREVKKELYRSEQERLAYNEAIACYKPPNYPNTITDIFCPDSFRVASEGIWIDSITLGAWDYSDTVRVYVSAFYASDSISVRWTTWKGHTE